MTFVCSLVSLVKITTVSSEVNLSSYSITLYVAKVTGCICSFERFQNYHIEQKK